jgi:biopolymer transport protein ExbD
MSQWRTFFAALALLHCRSSQSERAQLHPSSTSSAASADTWSAQSAIATCEAAVDATVGRPPESRRANALMLSCTSLVRGPACRKATAEQLNAPSSGAIRAAIVRCASEYCKQLSQENELAACHTPLPDAPEELRSAWMSLRRAMLIHDFSETDRARAAALLMKASEHALRVPPPSMRAEDLSPPKIEIWVKSDGSIAVRKNGSALGSVRSAAGLSEVLPRCVEDDPVSIAFEHSVEYATVIMVIDELRSMECGPVSFGVAR